MCDRINPPACMTVRAAPKGRGRPLAKAATGLRARAWWLMRTLGKPFTIEELLLTLNDSGAKDAYDNLRRFINRLEAVGVLKRQQRRAPGRAITSNGLVIWRLVQDLGPQAPVCRRTGGLWDPNAQRLLQAGAAAAAAAQEPQA